MLSISRSHWVCAQVFSAVLYALLLPVRGAAAQDLQHIAVFHAAIDDASLKDLAQALDPVLVAEINGLPGIQVTSQPALDLPAMQLAIDCVGETADCLRAVTTQAVTDGIVAPTLRRAGAETIITLLHFDARGAGSMKGVTRRYNGPDIEQPLFDGIPEMLRELFDLPPERVTAPTHAKAQPAPTTTAEPARAEQHTGLPLAPLVTIAAGVAVLGVGVVFGIVAKSTQDDYAKLPVTSSAQARAAVDKLDSAKTQATIANVGFIAGGAAIATGVVLWALHVGARNDAAPEPSAALAPSLGPGELGFTVRGHWPMGAL